MLFLFVRANALRTWEAFSKGRNEKYFLVLVLTHSLTRSGFVARRVIPDFLREPFGIMRSLLADPKRLCMGCGG